MSFALRFREHDDFHRASLLMLAACAGAGLLYWLAVSQGISAWWVAAPVALGAAHAIGRNVGADDAPRRRGLWLFRSAFLFLGMAAVLSLAGYKGLVGFGLAFGLAFAVGLRGKRALLSAIAGGLGGALALEVGARVALSAELSSVPPALLGVTAGSAFALTMAVPLAMRHLDLALDRVAGRYPGVKSSTSGEIQELVVRSYGVWTQVRDLPEEDPNRALLEEAVLKLFDTAEKWGASEIDGQRDSEASLRERMESLMGRIESAKDEQVKKEYEQAHGALAEQLKYLSGIDASRERVVARLHNYLAAMERLRLATLNLRSTDASRDPAEVAPMVSTLEELGREIGRDPGPE